jgi:hypothetical protein
MVCPTLSAILLWVITPNLTRTLYAPRDFTPVTAPHLTRPLYSPGAIISCQHDDKKNLSHQVVKRYLSARAWVKLLSATSANHTVYSLACMQIETKQMMSFTCKIIYNFKKIIILKSSIKSNFDCSIRSLTIKISLDYIWMYFLFILLNQACIFFVAYTCGTNSTNSQNKEFVGTKQIISTHRINIFVLLLDKLFELTKQTYFFRQFI